ncbi:hypothetical protein DSO57_1033755 [Entomophthora muscae]|uniref:Uncharacterized protein n=1 Tax=Entomophthora muscae TaxID=34485 RepID=A0ACC2TLX8_9FUNG|nr:hypothetical protein DSO57_1033755 [Entomophthora muscae]
MQLYARVQLKRVPPITTPGDAAALLLMKRKIQKECPQCMDASLLKFLGEDVVELKLNDTLWGANATLAKIKNATKVGAASEEFELLKSEVK